MTEEDYTIEKEIVKLGLRFERIEHYQRIIMERIVVMDEEFKNYQHKQIFLQTKIKDDSLKDNSK